MFCSIGCGRFFEGSAEEMNTALNKTLAALPDDTKVYVRISIHITETFTNLEKPGHEYTKANVKFAMSVLQSEPVKALSSFAENNNQTQGKFTIGDEKVRLQLYYSKKRLLTNTFRNTTYL